jgi:hypothetical protein
MAKKPQPKKPKPMNNKKPNFKNLGSTIGGITSNPRPKKR